MSLKDIVERPSASDRLWPKFRPYFITYRFWGLVITLIGIWVSSVFFTPATELTSIRLGERVEDPSAPAGSVFASGSMVGMRIAYKHGNWVTLEVELADPSGTKIRGLTNSCDKFYLREESGVYYCAYADIPPGKYQFLLWLKGAVKGHYPFVVNPPVPQAVPQPAPQIMPLGAPVAEKPPASVTIPVRRQVPGAHTAPPYPPLSIRNEEQGKSLLLVTIGTDGAVSECVIDKSSGFARLDDAACKHVTRNWKWPRPQQNGEPAILQTRVEINWQIKDAPGGGGSKSR